MMMYVLAIYAVFSVITLFAFGIDKRAAVKGRSRTPEKRLHLFELVGGFPGAFLGMKLFKHKRRKTRYMITLWAIVLLHGAGWTAWFAYVR